jgi:hypothetical protein
VRQCFNGTLTGNYGYAACSVQACAVPVVIHSATLGGAPRNTFTTAEIIHGRVLNLLAHNAQGCVEIVGSTDGYCNSLGNWTTMPNGDWTYDASSGLWRNAISPGTYPPGQYRGFWRNSVTGQMSAADVLTLTAPDPVVTYALSLGGSPQNTFSRRDTIHGAVVNLTANNAQSCVEIVGTNDGFCGTVGSWTTMPNNDWTFDAASGRWRSAFWAGPFPAGQYRGYWRNSQTGQLSVASVLTLLEAEPEIFYSTSVDGPPQNTFPVGQPIQGRVVYLGPTNAQSCVEIVGTNDGFCGNLGNWTNMPNNDWSYDASSSQWRAVIQTAGYPVGQYRGYWRNTLTGQQSVASVLTLVP